jgi:preprotein translocase subunit SecG
LGLQTRGADGKKCGAPLVLSGIISRCDQGLQRAAELERLDPNQEGCKIQGAIRVRAGAEIEPRNKKQMSIAVMIFIFWPVWALILVVLLQAGKGASMGAAFGGASQTVFGSSGATTFLAKMTTVVAVLFMITSLTLAYLSASNGPSSVMEQPPAASDKPGRLRPSPMQDAHTGPPLKADQSSEPSKAPAPGTGG